MECFVCHARQTMETWQRDWRDRRVDRLEERVDAIEEARRKEKQRAFERTLYALVVVFWVLMVVSVVVGLSS